MRFVENNHFYLFQFVIIFKLKLLAIRNYVKQINLIIIF